MEKIARLISVVAIAMVLMIAFSGVASAASWNTLIGYDRTEMGDQGFDLWKSSSTSNFGSFEGMSAYNRLLATDLQATTSAEVGITNNPFLNYNLDAGGLNEGSMATGRISAGMNVYVAGDPLSYEDRSSARGSFVFHTSYGYTSKIATP